MNKFVSVALIVVPCIVQAQEAVSYSSPSYLFDKGVGLGTVIAVVISWSRNKSILYAILHGIFGWLYVIYAAINRREDRV